MRWLISSLLMCAAGAMPAQASSLTNDALVVAMPDSINIAPNGQDTKYDRRMFRYRKSWGALIPTHLIVQNAGNMGVVSAGIGWSYGRHRQWETSLMMGFIPKYHSSRPKLTTTLKETYVPFRHHYRDGWVSELLTCGLYVNTVYGHEFWRSQPGRYPDDYYKLLSTRFRLNVFVGQRLTKMIPYNKQKFVKSVSLFYEVSTCDLYIRAMTQSKVVKLQDILGLSFGLKLQIL